MDRLDAVYRARTPDELRDSYTAWAEDYDRDLVEGMGWDKPQRVGELLLRHTTPAARVLDVGAGTGLLGAFLSERGYRDLTALDFTPAMLAQAGARGVYRELLQLDLNQPLPLPSGSYDVVAGVGIFTEGHLGPACLVELGRISRGPVAFSLRDDLYESLGFAAELERLQWPVRERQVFQDGLEGRPWSAWLVR